MRTAKISRSTLPTYFSAVVIRVFGSASTKAGAPKDAPVYPSHQLSAPQVRDVGFTQQGKFLGSASFLSFRTPPPS